MWGIDTMNWMNRDYATRHREICVSMKKEGERRRVQLLPYRLIFEKRSSLVSRDDVVRALETEIPGAVLHRYYQDMFIPLSCPAVYYVWYYVADDPSVMETM